MFCKPPQSNPSTTDLARDEFFDLEHQPHEVSVTPSSLKFHEIRSVIGGAFGGKTPTSGEPMMMYMIQSMGIQNSTKDRQEVAGFLLGIFAYETLNKNGIAIGIRDNKGQLRAVVVFREYDRAKEAARHGTLLDKICKFVTSLRAYMAMKRDQTGIPAILNDKEKKEKLDRISKDFMPVEKVLYEYHTQYGPTNKPRHWYVALVASDPETQGEGYGRQVMELLSRAADEYGMACYLECPAKNRFFYEKFGYTVTKEICLEIGDDFKGSGFLMTRQPNNKADN